MKSKEVKEATKNFYGKAKVVKPKTPEEAANLGIRAAVERNPTYKANISKADKTKIHKKWTGLLIGLLEKYQLPQTPETFINDVAYLCTAMNESQFKKLFINAGRGNDNNYPKCFRVAHAQKSLSVFLKHMWLIRDDMPTPPVCPIDGIILKAVGSNGAWTKLNDLDEYKEFLRIVKKVSGDNMAEWELLKWNSIITKSKVQPSHQTTSLNQNKEDKRTNRTGHKVFERDTRNNGADKVSEGYRFIIDNDFFRLIVAQRSSGSHNYYCRLGCENKNVNSSTMKKAEDSLMKHHDGKLKGSNYYKYVEFDSKEEGKHKGLHLMKKILLNFNAPKEITDSIL